MAPLVAIFFATVFSSLLIIFVIALIIEARLFAGIFKNLPIINELIGRKRRSERKND
jgi:archaellum component FlaG (FlaF/FlaG flagellin family)